jgi:hypothetical protein
MRGPYVLSRLSVDSFVATTREAVWAQVDEFLVESGQPVSRSDLGIDELVGMVIDKADDSSSSKERRQISTKTHGL